MSETRIYTLEEQKANRKLWVEALRSGKYEQAVGTLQNRHGAMCCLGVLAGLAGCKFTFSDRTTDFPYVDELDGDQFAPYAAMIFVGLTDNIGCFADRSLAATNDDGATFAEIADIIESEPPGLFAEASDV